MPGAPVLGAPRIMRSSWAPRGGSRDDVLVDACRADGVPILRRSSGGGTVVVGTRDAQRDGDPARIGGSGLSAVETAQRYVLNGSPARSEGSAGRSTSWGEGDLTLGGRKCGGSAQRRLKNWFMVHCSILNEFAIERIVRYLAIPDRQPAYRAGRAHQEFLSNLDLPRGSLVDALCEAWLPGSSLAAAPAWPR